MMIDSVETQAIVSLLGCCCGLCKKKTECLQSIQNLIQVEYCLFFEMGDEE